MDTRLNWTFTPTLSLELFAQPFVFAGETASSRSTRRRGRPSGRSTARRGRFVRRRRWRGYTVDPDRDAATAGHLARQPRPRLPQPARQRGAALGVPAGLHPLLRLAAAARAPSFGDFEFGATRTPSSRAAGQHRRDQGELLDREVGNGNGDLTQSRRDAEATAWLSRVYAFLLHYQILKTGLHITRSQRSQRSDPPLR